MSGSGAGGWHLPGTGALARARRRVGPAPFRVLFARLAGPLAGRGTPGAFAFGPPPAGGGHGAFPQVRVVTLVACGTHAIIDAVFRGRRARAGGKPRTERVLLITTILDWRAAPAAELAACYAQRWEIENSYRELKVFTRGPGQVLRSQTPAGITQEIWALLCACQLTCAHRARAAAAAGHDPDRISCTITLRAITTPAPASSITTEALATLLPQLPPPPEHQHRQTARRPRRPDRRAITHKITIITPARANDLPGP